jgi:hypothetical protein
MLNAHTRAFLEHGIRIVIAGMGVEAAAADGPVVSIDYCLLAVRRKAAIDPRWHKLADDIEANRPEAERLIAGMLGML